MLLDTRRNLMPKSIMLYLIVIYFGFINLYIDNSIFDDVKNSDEQYYFRLEIPDISLNTVVYDYENKNNNVDKGVYLARDYDLKTLSGSLVLASHSGSSSISYFKNLDKLKKDDIVNVYYKENKFIYRINKIYKIDKTGLFKYQNKDQYIYLITCDKNHSKKQLVFRGKIEKIVKNDKKLKKKQFFL